MSPTESKHIDMRGFVYVCGMRSFATSRGSFNLRLSDLSRVRLIHVDHGRMEIPHSIANAQSEQIRITKKMEFHITKAERILSSGELKKRKIHSQKEEKEKGRQWL